HRDECRCRIVGRRCHVARCTTCLHIDQPRAAVTSDRGDRVIEGITEYARAELARISTVSDRDGIAVPDLGGSLLRPVVALAGWRSLSSLPPTEEFWFGALA